MTTAVHQIVPVLARHDAVGGHTLRVQAALRAEGIASEIFAEVIVGSGLPHAHRLADFDTAGGPDADLLLYQASTGADAADWLLSRREPFAINHHNVTPARFFERWAPDAADSMRRARNQLKAMASRSVAALADSPFNAEELVTMGYRNVSVTPLLLDVPAGRPAADERTAAHLAAQGGGARWLFVGRLAPNKCQHDIVAAFAAYRRMYDPAARLTFVGSPAAITYQEAVLALADDLEVEAALTIVSGLSDEELAAHYDAADVFVCLSEHEGFCVPIVEAFRHDTPVVAFAAAAVPDTAGAGAVLLPDKDPLVVATAVHELLADDAFRAQLVRSGRERLADFALARTVPDFVAAVNQAVVLAGTSGSHG